MHICKRALAFIVFSILAASLASGATTTVFSVSFPKTRSDKPIDGRILLILSTDPSAEPRMQINDTPKTQIIFGVDVDGLKPDQAKIVDSSAAGYPIKNLRDVPPGEYYVQAVLHVYE